MSVDFLGTRIDPYTPEEVIDELVSRVKLRRRTRVFFVNAHCVNVARHDAEYRSCLSRAELVLPDGSGVLLACRLLGIPIRHNLNGTDRVPELLGRMAHAGGRIFLLGGHEGVAATAAVRLSERMPGLRVVGHAHGYVTRAEEEAVIQRITELAPDVLLVGKGVPLQEIWLDRNWDRLDVPVGIGVGALIDFEAGLFPRAPRWMRQAGIEWCWRLGHEPRRLARRYLVGNAAFMLDVARWRMRQALKPAPPLF